MTEGTRNFGILMLLGLVPFWLAGGFRPGESVWPWLAGFSTQAGFVVGFLAYRRWGRDWWRPWAR